MWLLIAVVGDLQITWHASGYCKSTTGRIGSHAHHNLSDQECLAGNLIGKHGVRRNLTAGYLRVYTICQVRGSREDVTTLFHITTVSSCDNLYLHYRDRAKTDPKPRPVAR